MIIDKELIKRAKEELGDRTAEVVRDFLNVENWNDRDKKCSCPFHAGDDKPSFIFNKSNLTFHCFGSCGRSWDILDIYQTKGMTYVEAVQKLFAETNTEYSFGEHKLQTESNYIYPDEVPLNDKKIVYEYWGKRKISKATIDYCDVREDSHGNTVFNYYDLNDTLTCVKYRPSHKVDKNSDTPKSWFQKGKSTKQLLWNMNRINTTEPLLICEGCPDCMSAIESGFTNAVSVPTGATNYNWIEENKDWLDQFDVILICSDADAAGYKMRDEVQHRLGAFRTKIVEIPKVFVTLPDGSKKRLNDLNETLYYFGKEKVKEIIKDAVYAPIETVEDLADIDDEDICNMPGLKTGIKGLDRLLLKLFYTTVTILTAKAGSGKSSLTYQIISNAVEQDVSTFLYSKEMPMSLSRGWLNQIIAGDRWVETKQTEEGGRYSIVLPEAKKRITKYLKGKISCYKDEMSDDIDAILESAIACIRQKGARLIVLDNLMCITTEGENDEFKSQAIIIRKLITFARKYNVAVLLLAHPKKFSQTETFSADSINGTAKLNNLAHRTIGLTRLPQSESGGYNAKIEIFKDRLGLCSQGAGVPLYYQISCRRFYEDYESYAFNYGWDKDNNMTLPVPYALHTANNNNKEVFG